MVLMLLHTCVKCWCFGDYHYLGHLLLFSDVGFLDIQVIYNTRQIKLFALFVNMWSCEIYAVRYCQSLWGWDWTELYFDLIKLNVWIHVSIFSCHFNLVVEAFLTHAYVVSLLHYCMRSTCKYVEYIKCKIVLVDFLCSWY